MKKIQKGSFTIEAAVVIPLLLFAIGIIMMMLLYCHDKNVLAGAAGEAVSVEAGRAGGGDFNELVKDRLLWFRNSQIEIKEKKGYIVATARASRGITSVRVEAKMEENEPETFIRNIRKIEKLTGGEDENILSNGFE